MSAGCATRRSGVFAMLRSRPSSPRKAETRGVHTTPGATALTRMPGGPELDRAGAHQRHQPGLGRAVRRVPRRRRDARHRRDEHHHAAAARVHRPPAVLHGEERVAQHDVEVPVPVLVGHLDEVGVPGHADDVDDAVDPAELRGRRRRTGARRRRGRWRRPRARRRRPRRRCRRRGRDRLVDAGEPGARPTRARATPGGRCPGPRRARRSAARRGAAARDSRGPGCRRCGS